MPFGSLNRRICGSLTLPYPRNVRRNEIWRIGNERNTWIRRRCLYPLGIKKRISEILDKLDDHSSQSDCLIFFRPSFSRSGGKGSAQFGEFDSILASSKNIYLISFAWVNFTSPNTGHTATPRYAKIRHSRTLHVHNTLYPMPLLIFRNHQQE